MKEDMKDALGLTLKDVITGFTGVAVGYVRYLTGCNQYLLIPPIDKDGKRVDGEWFDESRLTPISGEPRKELPGAPVLSEVKAESKGPDQQAPKR